MPSWIGCKNREGHHVPIAAGALRGWGRIRFDRSFDGLAKSHHVTHQDVERVLRWPRLIDGLADGGSDAAPLDLIKGDGGSRAERLDSLRDGVLLRTGIRQRAHQHVTANARKGIEVAS